MKEQPIAIYHYDAEHIVGTPFEEKNFELIKAEGYNELTHLPNATLEWYRHLHEQGKFGAHFHAIPHVMVKGTVDIDNVRIIDWKEPPEF